MGDPRVASIRRSALFRIIAQFVRSRRRIVQQPLSEDSHSARRFRAVVWGIGLGEATLVVRPDADGPLAGYWLMALRVHPAARRMGVATALCEAIIDTARAEGAPRLLLSVRSTNAPAIGIYERYGFIPLPSDGPLAPELRRLEALGRAPYIAMELRIEPDPKSSESCGRKRPDGQRADQA